MSRRASWMSSYFYEKSWKSSRCCIYPFFFGLACVLFASYKFLPFPFYLLVNSFLLAIGTIFCVQVLMRYSKPSAAKNEKNECISHSASPYKLNLVRNDLRARKLESFRFNPQVKSRRTFKGMKVRAVIAEDNSSSSADGKAVEEDDGMQMGTPAVSSISWPTEDYMSRSRVEDAEKALLLDDDADKAKLDNHSGSCLGSPWCLVDHQETALDTKSDPVNAEEKPDGVAFSENLVVNDGSAEEAQNKDGNEGEKAHKEKDDGAHKEKDEGDKVSSTSTAWTADVPRNPMNLGDSEHERNRRLESLIAKRKARKAMEKNQTDLDGMQGPESHCLLPFVNAPRNSHDFLYDFDDPIPGSAPSLLNPRKNPFDLPTYDLVDHDDRQKLEQNNPVPVPMHREFIFARHQSFTMGAFMQERRPSRFNFFMAEQKNELPLDSVDADVRRLLHEAKASRISFSSESDSHSEISQGEQEDLPQENESPFKLDVENTEEEESRMKMNTDHDTQVVKHFEAVQDDSEGSVSSSLVTFAERAEVIDDKYENISSAPSEEEKGISRTSTHEQAISGFCEDNRDSVAVDSDAMNVNDQIYRNLLHEEPVHDCTLPEVENRIFKTSTHKQEIDGSCEELMNSMAVDSDAVNMDEADQIHRNLVHKELVRVSTSLEVENNNYKISTREVDISSDSCQDFMKLVAVNSVDSDAVNMDKADQTHQNLVHEEHVQVFTSSPEAKNRAYNTSTRVQEINGSCEDSMNSVAVDSDTVSAGEQNLVCEESVSVCISPEAQNSTSKTSTHEQVNGVSCKDSMDSMVVKSDIMNVNEAAEVNQKIVVEPVHGSNSLEAENKNSKTSTHEQVIGSSCTDSMDSTDVDFDTVNVDKKDQVCHNLVHVEPVHVSTSPEAENNASKTSSHEQEIGGSSEESTDSVAVDYDVLNIDKADRVHQNLNHEEHVHVSTLPDAENNSLKTGTHDQVIDETSEVCMDTMAMDSAAKVEEAAQVDDNDVSTPTPDQTTSIADKGDSNDKEILLAGVNGSLSGEGSPLKAVADGDISAGGRTDENESAAKETSETKDLDAAGNDAPRVQEDLGGG